LFQYVSTRNIILPKMHLRVKNENHSYGKILRQFMGGDGEKFLSTHHERDIETGLDNRGARFYDAEVGKFLSLDPLAIKYPSLSAYNYVAGNPVIYIDPDGKEVEIVWVSWGWGDSKFGHVALNLTGRDVVKTSATDAQGISGNRYYPGSGGFNNYITPDAVPDPSGSGGAVQPRQYPDLSSDVKDYMKEGRTITKAVYDVPAEVGKQLNEILYDLYLNPGSEGQYGAYCGQKIQNIIRNAYKAAGFTDEDADKEASKMINSTIPIFSDTDPSDLLEEGAKEVDVMSPVKDDNGDYTESGVTEKYSPQ